MHIPEMSLGSPWSQWEGVSSCTVTGPERGTPPRTDPLEVAAKGPGIAPGGCGETQSVSTKKGEVAPVTVL